MFRLAMAVEADYPGFSICLRRQVSARHEPIRRRGRSGASEIIDCQVGLARFQAPIPYDIRSSRTRRLWWRQLLGCAHSCQTFRVGDHGDQTGEGAAVGEVRG